MATDDLDGPDADDKRFAMNMQQHRERMGFSQADLVRELRDNGWTTVHQTTISRIEKGDRPVRLGEARAIAKALKADFGQLLLPPGESELARLLADQRAQMHQAHRSLTKAGEDFYGTLSTLELAIEGAIQQGVIPTQTSDSDLLTSTGTVEDELALAIRTAKRDPIQSLMLGKKAWEHELEKIEHLLRKRDLLGSDDDSPA